LAGRAHFFSSWCSGAGACLADPASTCWRSAGDSSVAGMLWLKIVADPEPGAPRLLGTEFAFVLLIWLTAVTGLVLLGLRATSAMGTLLAIHLGCVLALFVVMPYSKFVHGIYRGAALLRNAAEADASVAER